MYLLPETYREGGCRRGRDCMVVDLQLPMQSMPITTDVVSSNLLRAKCTTLCDKVCR
jgi:hypothetical protein